MKSIIPALALLGLSAVTTNARPVMAWAPYYKLEDSKATLNASYGGVKVSEAITRLGLQFYFLDTSGNGKVENRVSDEDTKWFLDYGKTHGTKILLTVVNTTDGFDWNLTRKACYGATGDTTIRNLLKIVDSLGFDGVDLDIEGEDGRGGPFTADDRAQYKVFVDKITDSLHARGKLLTIDTYSGTSYGAPKATWWSDYPNVDAVHTMAYFSSYWNAPGNMSYQAQQDLGTKAGLQANRLLMGLPVWLDKWSGDQSNTGATAQTNLGYIQNCLKSQTGVTLWDIHHPEGVGTWKDGAIWQTLKDIATDKAPDTSLCPKDTRDPAVLDDMSSRNYNLDGGMWYAHSDYWSRPKADQGTAHTAVRDRFMYDMANGEGTWGKLDDGYDLSSNGLPYLAGVVDVVKELSGQSSYGGFQMEFLPRDCELNPDACWDINKTLPEKDLSGHDSLVVAMACGVGQKVRVSLQSKADRYTPIGRWVDCDGTFRNESFVFKDLRNLKDTTKIGFDPSHAWTLQFTYVSPTAPARGEIRIAGVAVDKAPRVELPTETVAIHPNQNAQNPWNAQMDAKGILVQGMTEGEAILRDLQGKTIAKIQLNKGQGLWPQTLSSGLYTLQLIHQNQSQAQTTRIP